MDRQGETYAAHIKAEFDTEYARTTALNGRATTVTVSSSAFLGLAISLTALVAGKDFTVQNLGSWAILISLALFAAASLASFIGAFSRRYHVPAIDTFLTMIGPHWKDHDVDARNAVAYANVVTIKSLRRGNNFKAGCLTIAAVFQLAAVTSLIVGLATRFGSLQT